MAVRVGVVLSGCGVFDGSEIHESVLTLLHLAKAGAKVTCLAPNVAQAHVVNHATGQPADETRNVLVEASRIARGPVTDVATVKATDFDALVFPGGFGAAKNLSDYAFKADKAQANPAVAKLVADAFAAKIPQGFICIAPVSVAAVALKGKGLKLTIGTDPATAAHVAALGHTHVPATVADIVTDDAHNIVSTPAYMLAQSVAEADQGIAKLVAEVLRRAQRKAAA